MKPSKNIDEFIYSIENDNKIDGDIIWSKRINEYANSLNRIRQITNHKNISSEIRDDLRNRIDNFIKDAKEPEFHIALVGAIKAGKSTLINAILGEDLASSSVTPETASLTKFKASKKSNYIKLDFYSSEEWKSLWESVQSSKSEVFMEKYNSLNGDLEKEKWIGKESIKIELDNFDALRYEIKKWTSCNSVTHYFVKEVEVGLVGFDIPTGVVYVDTPGLDDPVRYRSDITRNYIDRANAVLVCVNSSALTGQELSTIYKVFANARYSKDKIYIIGTQTDKLNNPIEHWKEQKTEWIMQLKGKDGYSSESLAEKNILGISSHTENLCRVHIKNKENKISNEIAMLAVKYNVADLGSIFNGNNYDFLALSNELRQHTGYYELRDKLYNEVVQKHSILLEAELAKEYKQLKIDILDKFSMIKKREQDLLNSNKESKDSIVNKRKNLKKNLEESKEEQNAIHSLLSDIEKITSERAAKLFKQIENIWRIV